MLARWVVRAVAIGSFAGCLGCPKTQPAGPVELPPYSADRRNRRAMGRHADRLFAEAHGLSRERQFSDAARFAMEGIAYRSAAVGSHSAAIAPSLLWVTDALIRDRRYAVAYKLATQAREIGERYGWSEIVWTANKRLGLLTRIRQGAKFSHIEDEIELEPPPPAGVPERRPRPSTTAVQGGKVEAFVEVPVVTAGYIEGAAATVASLRMRFGECYLQGRRAQPSMSGRIQLKLVVVADGRVIRIAHQSTGNLSQYVIDCVRWVASGAQFKPPAGGSAELLVPVDFERR